MGNKVMVKMGKCIMCWLVKCWQRRKGLMFDIPNHTPQEAAQLIFNLVFFLISYIYVPFKLTLFNV